ncbi:MAG: hypothetical protein L0287_10055 [Anaerolineae bacterium]|nr:hypothetical protein [Anaerolineae bacterium]
MNAWRCNACHSMFTDQTVSHDGKLLVCTECGSMVCNVTSTRMGQEFIAKKSHVPSRVRFSHMNRRLKTFDEGGQS